MVFKKELLLKSEILEVLYEKYFNFKYNFEILIPFL